MNKNCALWLVFAILVAVLGPLTFASAATDPTHPGFKVQGRYLYDKNGEKTILYGINKMIIWMDIDGDPSYPEIAKTGANVVRIVWTKDGTAQQLDTAIMNCRINHMIPMIEDHDATGDWSKLSSVVDYWTKADIVSVIQKHQEYLLINIANECGQTVSDADFRTGYETAVNRMRTAGIHVPLIIDAASYGQGINSLQANGPYLISKDPDQNLMFSVHMWWPYMWGHTDQEVIDEIAESVNMGLPLIVGEFANQWEQSTQGQIPYKTIMEQCAKNEVGYLIWEWGPGNNPQTFLDMTTDSTYATLQPWALEMAVTSQYSVKNLAKRPASIQATMPPTPSPTPMPAGNLALNKPVTVSSTENTTNIGANAVDGNLNTRWASAVSDPQTLTVDLGAKTDIGKVSIYWEAAYATQYKIQVSDDGNTFTDVYTTYAGDGGLDDVALTGVAGRYVRMYGMQRYNTSWPYSIYEFCVYGTGSSTATPTATPSTATATPTPTPSTATATPTPTPSTATATPTPTPSTATPTPTPSTATPTPTPSTATPTPTPSTATPTPTPSTATPTPTPSTATPTPTPTAGTPTPGGIKVQFFNGNTAATTNTLYPNFKVVNTGTAAINLSDVKVRYFFTNDGTQADSFACDYSTIGSGNVTSSFTTIAKTNADRYCEVGFTTAAGTLGAGASVEVKARIWKSDWSNFTQTNDYSFNATATNYVDSTTVTGYIAGALKWGTEP